MPLRSLPPYDSGILRLRAHEGTQARIKGQAVTSGALNSDVTDDAFYEWLLSGHPDARDERDWRRVGDELRYVLRDRIADWHRLSRPGPLGVGRIARPGDRGELARVQRTPRLVALAVMRNRRHRPVQS